MTANPSRLPYRWQLAARKYSFNRTSCEFFELLVFLLQFFEFADALG